MQCSVVQDDYKVIKYLKLIAILYLVRFELPSEKRLQDFWKATLDGLTSFPHYTGPKNTWDFYFSTFGFGTGHGYSCYLHLILQENVIY